MKFRTYFPLNSLLLDLFLKLVDIFKSAVFTASVSVETLVLILSGFSEFNVVIFENFFLTLQHILPVSDSESQLVNTAKGNSVEITSCVLTLMCMWKLYTFTFVYLFESCWR